MTCNSFCTLICSVTYFEIIKISKIRLRYLECHNDLILSDFNHLSCKITKIQSAQMSDFRNTYNFTFWSFRWTISTPFSSWAVCRWTWTSFSAWSWSFIKVLYHGTTPQIQRNVTVIVRSVPLNILSSSKSKRHIYYLVRCLPCDFLRFKNRITIDWILPILTWLISLGCLLKINFVGRRYAFNGHFLRIRMKI